MDVLVSGVRSPVHSSLEPGLAALVDEAQAIAVAWLSKTPRAAPGSQ